MESVIASISHLYVVVYKCTVSHVPPTQTLIIVVLNSTAPPLPSPNLCVGVSKDVYRAHQYSRLGDLQREHQARDSQGT